MDIRGDTSSPGTGYTRSVRYVLPVCWFTPSYTPQELSDQYDGLLLVPGLLPQMAPFPTDFHLGQAGIWWAPVCRDDAPFEDWWGWRQAHRATFYRWVLDGGGTPPEGIDWPDLLHIAREYTDLKSVPISTSPDTATVPSTVFLPTWIWVDRAAWDVPATVTASVPRMTVTTTARRKYLLLDPGTSADRAKVYGDTTYNGKVACSLGGSPYTGDAKAKPPCGVEYLHSTADSGPYPLQMSVVWEVSWSRNGADQGLVTEDPHILVKEPATSVTVREVQTAVSDAH